MSENSETFENINEANEMYVSRTLLQTNVEFYVDKIFNEEVKCIYILSSDEIEEEAVMISIDEYEYLKKISRKFAQCKTTMEISTEYIFSEIKEDMK